MSLKPNLRGELLVLLKELRMPTVRECYEDEAKRARKEALSYERYLLELVRREAEIRRQNRIDRLLRQSKLPLEKNLASFDLKRLALPVRQQIKVLLEGVARGQAHRVFAERQRRLPG